MRKGLRLAFEYGQSASASACPFAPCYDPRMYKLVTNSKSDSGIRQNIENMQAWHEGYISQTASAGQGISPEMFTSALSLLIDSRSEIASRWIAFADELVKRDQYVDFAENGEQAHPVDHWLEVLLAGLITVKKEHGGQIAKQICDLILQHSGLYPDQMLQAAEHLRNGGSPKNIDGKIRRADIDVNSSFFPKLYTPEEQDSPYTNMSWTILGI